MRFFTLMIFLSSVLIGCSERPKRQSNVFNFNLGGEPTTLNPLSSSDGYSQNVHSYIFESLLDRDLDSFDWKPALATDWIISKDNKIFEFKLREGVKWHDGEELTAEDVKYSYDVIFSDDFKAVQLRSYYESIDSVEVVDKYRVRFKVKDEYFKNFEVCAGITVLPKHFYTNQENKKEFGRKLIGTGPYLLTKYERGQKIILIKNPNWWGNNIESEKDTHNFSKIYLKFAQDLNVQLELLKKGDIDFLSFPFPEAFVKKTIGKVWDDKIVKVKTQNKTPKGFNFIAWNFKHPILKDKNVRKALSMLLNRPLILEKFEYNLSEPATGPIYVQSDYANPEVKPVEFNPKEALRILNQAGWRDSDKDGILDKILNGKKTDLSLTLMEPSQDMMKILTIYKEEARKIGVEINLKNIEWNSFVKLLDERNFDAVRLAWGAGGVDWEPKQIWHTKSSEGAGSNFISYSNSEVDKLIDESRKIYDKDKRILILRKVHKLIADDYPYVFFFNRNFTLYGHTKKLWKPKDTFEYGLGLQYWKIQ
jgi:ABC-type transport system substrate-binding protein